MAKGAESSLQSCTVLFCTVKWHGGQPGDNGLLSLKTRPAAPEESSFSAHMAAAASRDARPAAAACSASGHTRCAVCAAAARGRERGRVSPATPQGCRRSPPVALKRLGKGSTCGWREIPILLDLGSQNPHGANAPMGPKQRGQN